MDVLINFFAVRPVFTLFGLRLVWVLYLVDQAMPFVAVFNNPRITTTNVALFLLIFRACLNILLLRLLLEVAGGIILGRNHSQ